MLLATLPRTAASSNACHVGITHIGRPPSYASITHFCCKPHIYGRTHVGRPVAASAVQETDDLVPSTSAPVEWIEIGIVGPSHGVRGEFKVQPLTDFPEIRLEEPGPRWIRAPRPKIGPQNPPPPEEVELEWGRRSISKGHEVWLVKFEGIDTPEDAALIHGHTILIPPSDREPLDDEDEFYVQELVGLHVHLESSGEMVGTVVDIFDGTGTHDVLRIKMPDAVSSTSDDEEEGGENAGPRYFMLPFAKQFVPVVDVGANVMRIMPPEGLLELAAPVTQKKERKESAGKREKRRPKKPSQGRSEGGFFSSEGSE